MPTPDELVAEAMGAPPELLQLLPDLFADFTALGGWPRQVVELLRDRADLPASAEVVDLGCGKGAAAVAIAGELGHRVLGVDLFEPFLEDGVRAAATAGVDHLVSFRRGDLRDVIRGAEPFDAAVFAGIGAGIFGDFADCAGALRGCVRPGGYLAISDGFLIQTRQEGTAPPGYEYYRPHDQVLRQLAAHGDALVAETVIPPERFSQQCREDLKLLGAAVDRLLDSTPGRRAELETYLDSQKLEYEFLEGETREAVWLLRRA